MSSDQDSLLMNFVNLDFQSHTMKSAATNKSVMQQDSIEDLCPPMDQTFKQWTGDNVDHNIQTLGMGVIEMYLAKSHSSNQRVVRKARERSLRWLSTKAYQSTSTLVRLVRVFRMLYSSRSSPCSFRISHHQLYTIQMCCGSS